MRFARRTVLLRRSGPWQARWAASILVWTAISPLVAQPDAQPAPSGPGYFETVNVQVVNIDVYVTGADGKPVLGLGPGDFELRVDGRPVKISNFYAVELRDDELFVRRGGEVEAQPLAPAPTGDPREVDRRRREPAAIPPEQALHVAIYVDNFNLTPFNRNRVLRELRVFIREQLRPEDRVMLASSDPSLNLRLPFTNDREQLNRALLELEEVSAQRIHRNNERRDLIGNIVDVNNEFSREDRPEVAAAVRSGQSIGGGGNYARNQLMAYAGSVRNDTNLSIDALSRVVENLSAAPGRKALVYVADGIPMIAAEDIFYFVEQLYERSVSLIEMAEYDLSRRFQHVAAGANANRTSFYAVDARGLTVLSQGTVAAQTAGAPGQASLIDQIQVTNLQAPLQLMAEETGGRAVINANRVMPDLLKIADAYRNYYSQGYIPTTADTGRYHSIDVRWKNRPRGASVRFRKGYRSKTVESQMIEGTQSALNLNMQENPLGVRVDSLPAKRRSDGNYDVPIVVEVPWKELVLIPREGVHHGRIELWLAAKDENDRSTEPQRTELKIAVPEDRISETENGSWRYGLEVTLEAGYHDIGVGLRDDIGGRQSFLRGGIDVR
ncbi:MAG: VWA domain-containing protein [Acidobacteria bacterium]|nr:VWA domain-containing protein [Acidobacteriota bacterium]